MFFILATAVIVFELIVIVKLWKAHKEFDNAYKQRCGTKTPAYYADTIHQVLDGLHKIHEWNRPDIGATSTEIMTADLSSRLIESLEELIKNS